MRLLWVLLVLLNLLYLAGEAVFNSALLDFVAKGKADREILWKIEIAGRTLAGFGVILFVASTWGKRLKKKGSLTLATVLTGSFLVIFYGQKWLVDVYVKGTTWETRALAKSLLWLKAGMAQGYVQIDGVPVIGKAPLSPEDKTFLALIGWLAAASPNFIESAYAERDEVVRVLSMRWGRDLLDEAYENYLQQRKLIVDGYKKYAEASKEYVQIRRNDPIVADVAWKELNERVIRGFEKLMQARQDFLVRAKAQARQNQSKLKEFFIKYTDERCSKTCRKILFRKYYVPVMRNAFGQDSIVNPVFWCEPRYSRSYFKLKHGRHLYFDGEALIEDILNLFRKEKKPAYYDCSNAHALDEMVKRIVHLKNDEYKKKTGYSYTVTSLEEYLDHPQTHKKTRIQLHKAGIAVSDKWTLDNVDEFREAYMTNARKTIEKKWRSLSVTNFGEVLPPSLDYQAFVQHPAIQKKIRMAMGAYNVNGLDLEMSRSEFLKHVIVPVVQRRISEELSLLTGKAKELGENGRFAETGREAVRALVVPYIALFLSATVVVLSLVKMVLMIISSLLASVSRNNQVFVKAFIALAVVIALPLSLSNSYTESKAFNYFMEETRKQEPVTWITSAYLMRLQPTLVPIGESLRFWLVSTPALFYSSAVRSHLTKAKEALEADRLMTPRKNSAYAHYLAVLREHPYSMVAIRGLHRIVERYETLSVLRNSKIFKKRADKVRERIQIIRSSLPTLPAWKGLAGLFIFIAWILFFIYLTALRPDQEVWDDLHDN